MLLHINQLFQTLSLLYLFSCILSTTPRRLCCLPYGTPVANLYKLQCAKSSLPHIAKLIIRTACQRTHDQFTSTCFQFRKEMIWRLPSSLTKYWLYISLLSFITGCFHIGLLMPRNCFKSNTKFDSVTSARPCSFKIWNISLPLSKASAALDTFKCRLKP